MRCSSWSQLVALHRRDLSRGQLFLRSKKAPGPGTALRIQLLLPSGNKIELTGKVSVVVGADNSRGAGAVVALDPLSAAHRMTLDTALKALAEQQKRTTARRDAIRVPEPTAGHEDTLSFDQGRELVAAEDKLLSALRTELSTLAKLNPFQTLGVGYEADDDDVRAAFGELSKRYHPDRFVRYQSDAITQLAEALFVRARTAYKKTATTGARTLLVEQIRRERKPRNPPPPELLKLTGRGREPSPTKPQKPPFGSQTGAHDPRGEDAGAAATVRADESIGSAPTATATGTQRQATAAAIKESRIAPTRHLGKDRVAPTDGSSTSIAAEASESGSHPSATSPELDPLVAYPDARGMLDQKRFTDAAGLFGLAVKRDTKSEAARAGIELAEGLRALEEGDRLEAAQRFEAVLDLHPANEVAARELAKMRRRATNQRQGLLAKLMKDNG